MDILPPTNSVVSEQRENPIGLSDSFSSHIRPKNSLLLPDSPALPTETVNSPVSLKITTPIKSLSAEGDAENNSNSLDDTDLSSSFSALNIDAKCSSTPVLNSSSATPRTRAKEDFPNLESPQTACPENISSVEKEVHNPTHQSFGKIVSGVSRVSFESTGLGRKEETVDVYSLNDVGGMTEKIEELKQRIHRAQQPGSLSQCILIHGPPGTGKTLMVKALTNSMAVHTVYVSGTDIWSKLFGQAESNLRNIFQSAADRSPSIIVIDDLDVVCPKRSQRNAGQQEHRIVGTLLSLVDGAAGRKSGVVVLGLTNKCDNVDPALRRSGRFGCEVEIGVPNATQRAEILKVMLSRVPNSLSHAEITSVASNAHGYVGADLTALVNEASIHGATRLEGPLYAADETASSFISLTVEDLTYAGQIVKPSALREIQLEVPKVRWTDIGGMSEVKMRLREAVELPLTNPSLYHNLGIEPPRGLLMYGPPGCSKTMIARAVATECHLNFLAVKGPELFNQYVGESEKAIREVFRKARASSPSVVFFDEIDAIAAKRGSGSGGSGVDDRVLTQLLTEMDGLEHLKDVFIMAATNRPDKIDRALLRPGRFDSLVYVPLPDADTRGEILHAKLAKMKTSCGVKVDELVEVTQGYSGAEIIQLCQEAALTALREDIHAAQVRPCHFEAAAIKVLPQTDQELLHIYHKFSTSR